MPTSTWVAVKGPNGDLTWRVESPAHAVGAKVLYVPDDGAEQIGWPNLDGAFPWVMTGRYDDGSPARITSRKEWEGAIEDHSQLLDTEIEYPWMEGESAVFTRPLAWLAAHMIELRRQGVRVLSECDDNYVSAQSLNAFMRKAGWGENDRNHHMRALCSSDGIIFSTEYLRDIYWRDLRKEFGKKHLPEMFVCRNHVDERFVPKELVPSREDGKLRIGYMGSDSHIWDIELIYEALVYAYDQGHEIVFIGIHPTESPAALNSPSRKDWSRIGFTYIPWSNSYRGFALPLDIGFAPLLVNDHTLGKSDIKWLEYGLSGAACIAHNCLVYNRTAKHQETALLSGSPRDYVTQLKTLIDDAALRRRLVDNTRQYIDEERLLSKNTEEWKAAVFG